VNELGNSFTMQNLAHGIEIRNGFMPFRDRHGRLVVAVPCGGWRLATRLEAATLPQPRRLVIIREEA